MGRLVLAVATREEPYLLPLRDHFEALQARMTEEEHKDFRACLGHLIDLIEHTQE